LENNYGSPQAEIEMPKIPRHKDQRWKENAELGQRSSLLWILISSPNSICSDLSRCWLSTEICQED
jgi:hypothetical protein